MSTSYQPQPDHSESNDDLIVHEGEEQTGERSRVSSAICSVLSRRIP